jgi:ankyrin repeat protein
LTNLNFHSFFFFKLKNGYADVCEILLDANADMEIKNDDEDTPLMLAVRSEHSSVVDLLCQRGCDVHTQGFDRIQPIDYAVNKRNMYLSEMLLKHERRQSSNSSSTGQINNSSLNRQSSGHYSNTSNESQVQYILKNGDDNNNDKTLPSPSLAPSPSSPQHKQKILSSTISHDSVFQEEEEE